MATASVGSALAAARKRMRDEGSGGVAPNTIEWHAIPVDQRVGRCRASLESLPILLTAGGATTAATSSVVVDLAGYVYSATALVDILLARATAKKSAPVSEEATTLASTSAHQAAVDPLSHIRKFKRDVYGLVLIGHNSMDGAAQQPNPFDSKLPHSNRFICIVPKIAEGAEVGGSRCGYVIGEDVLREYWLHEINSQLKNFKPQSESTTTTTTAPNTNTSSPSSVVELTVPQNTTHTGSGKGEVVFALSHTIAHYIRTWVLNRPLTTTFDHCATFPLTTVEEASSTAPMSARLKQHAAVSEGVTHAVSQCLHLPLNLVTTGRSDVGFNATTLTSQLEDLAKCLTSYRTTSTSSDVASPSTCGRLPWFTELRLVIASTASATKDEKHGQLLELFPRTFTEATLSLALSHHEHN